MPTGRTPLHLHVCFFLRTHCPSGKLEKNSSQATSTDCMSLIAPCKQNSPRGVISFMAPKSIDQLTQFSGISRKSPERCRHSKRCRDDGHQPEPQDDFCFRNATKHKVVMQRTAQEYPFASPAKPGHLKNHAQRLNDKHDADDRQQQLRPCTQCRDRQQGTAGHGPHLRARWRHHRQCAFSGDPVQFGEQGGRHGARELHAVAGSAGP